LLAGNKQSCPLVTDFSFDFRIFSTQNFEGLNIDDLIPYAQTISVKNFQNWSRKILDVIRTKITTFF